MRIALASDHAGFGQLRRLIDFLESQGHQCLNFGPRHDDPEDDYPDFIIPAARAVAAGECQRGIIMGGSGQGEAMAANRLRGVRCAVYYGPAAMLGSSDGQPQPNGEPYAILRLSREHNDANMLSIGARFVGQAGIEHAVTLWLKTEFSNEERHQRRNAKLDKEI